VLPSIVERSTFGNSLCEKEVVLKIKIAKRVKIGFIKKMLKI
jgi:hypothetical protein